MKKMFSMLLCIAMAAMVLGGCASGNASGTGATAAPIVTSSPRTTAMMLTPTTSPMASPMTSPDEAAGMTSGATTWQKDNAQGATASDNMTPAQNGKLAEQVAEAVVRISEIDEAEVVIQDGRVLVAVEFEDQYKMGLDERMKQIITDAVKKVDGNLTEIRITDDNTLMGQIEGFGDRLAKANGMDELSADFTDLWDRVMGN